MEQPSTSRRISFLEVKVFQLGLTPGTRSVVLGQRRTTLLHFQKRLLGLHPPVFMSVDVGKVVENLKSFKIRNHRIHARNFKCLLQSALGFVSSSGVLLNLSLQSQKVTDIEKVILDSLIGRPEDPFIDCQ